MAQMVTVTAVDDSVDEPSIHTGTISHSASSSDANYSGITILKVTANVTNNDPADLSAVFRDGRWFFDLDRSGGGAEKTFAFGIRDDRPVAGDWEGDGDGDAAIFRNGRWFFDLNNAGGPAEKTFAFGSAGDLPVAGDWDGDGDADAAVFRGGRWFFDLDNAGGLAEKTFAFGIPGDLPVAGDWDGDGDADAAVFRGGRWFFDLNDSGGSAEKTFAFGILGDGPVAGRWPLSPSGTATPAFKSTLPEIDGWEVADKDAGDAVPKAAAGWAASSGQKGSITTPINQGAGFSRRAAHALLSSLPDNRATDEPHAAAATDEALLELLDEWQTESILSRETLIASSTLR